MVITSVQQLDVNKNVRYSNGGKAGKHATRPSPCPKRVDLNTDVFISKHKMLHLGQHTRKNKP